MAGYSGTPLPKKLGIRPGSAIRLIDAPPGYRALLEPLPEGARFVTRLTETTDLVHVFSSRRAGLAKALRQIRDGMRPDAAIWVSWPKKSARVPTDVTD